MQAYGQCLSAGSAADSPWFVVPTDDKESARLILSRIVLDAFEGMKMSYPVVSSERKRELDAIRKQLEKKG
jgi:hypothetical protein